MTGRRRGEDGRGIDGASATVASGASPVRRRELKEKRGDLVGGK